MKTATKQGDTGMTDIKGKRMLKADPLLEAIGTTDECMAEMVLLAAQFPEDKKELETVVEYLSALCATLAGYGDRALFPAQFLAHIEAAIETLEQTLPPFQFTYPYSNIKAAQWNRLRTKVRQMERRIWAVHQKTDLSKENMAVLNRISDWCYLKSIEILTNE